MKQRDKIFLGACTFFCCFGLGLGIPGLIFITNGFPNPTTFGMCKIVNDVCSFTSPNTTITSLFAEYTEKGDESWTKDDYMSLGGRYSCDDNPFCPRRILSMRRRIWS
eukprot:TRINITY_DN9179_c0_g1_i1.p2 TRINITY_DN9179_c0_g1~~TRINITY_DN9179_c0_g1_i1.p2  ORF type:complete len:118 (+),score=15.96 TRINITY_DN9179_c0_g1_i1:31-354(+)